jgi:hypothetical protein
MHRSANEIIRILDMLQENNEPVTLDGVYVCSYYTDKSDCLADLNELVDTGVLAALADGTYTRALDWVKLAMEERARQEIIALRVKHGYGNDCWGDEGE